METIGQILKKARLAKKYSFKELEEETKIKSSFIQAIEKEDWQALPELPVVLGFVKNIASFLNIDVRRVTASLKRDYPPQDLEVNPQPELGKKFVWTPKLTFFVGVLALSSLILGYLSFQYLQFISPPKLEIYVPKDNETISQKKLTVSGVTSPDATVKINNQPVLVDEEGMFQSELEVSEKTKEIVVVAVSRSGKEAVIKRTINVNLIN
jgi:cytoskeletal protein RodZ